MEQHVHDTETDAQAQRTDSWVPRWAWGREGIWLVRLEGLIFQVDAMEKEKAEIIRRKVSSLFDICEVEMEERKKDGGFTPACNILVCGVKAQVTNTASKILAGADIAKAFAKFYELNMPLIVDNRERVDDHIMLGAEGQQVVELKRDNVEFTVL